MIKDQLCTTDLIFQNWIGKNIKIFKETKEQLRMVPVNEK